MAEVKDNYNEQLTAADGFLRRRQPHQALVVCERLMELSPQASAPRLIAARAYQMLHKIDDMTLQIEAVLEKYPDHFDACLMQVEALISDGQIKKARGSLDAMARIEELHALQLARIAEIQTQLNDHAGALSTLLRATKAVSNPLSMPPGLLYNLASAHIAVGNLEDAETVLDTLISVHPEDYDAYYNRATLRVQTPDNNHIRQLDRRLSASNLPPMGEVQLSYALAKEYEDLGQYKTSFAALTRGAKKRREQLSYDVHKDTDVMAYLADVFDHQFIDSCFEGCMDERPVFIVGLPRSGTTLTDRIISSHPDAESVGEINDLPMAITRLCGAADSKLGLIDTAAQLDMVALGRAYIAGIDGRGAYSKRVVDKTPLNFLYIGLIAKALPKARIIHVNRSDMDVGYAMFKTLFRMGYPFSYDQGDLAHYISAKNKLMAHWHAVLPGHIHEVAYGDLISDQIGTSRKLIKGAGLPWDEACLNFHANPSASSTASAAQIRRPIYKSSVEKWRHYELELAPLLKGLS